jgi:hypothetical protein
MTTKTKALIGVAALAVGAGVMAYALFPTCWGEIPSCPSCELVFTAPSSAAKGKFTCLASKYRRAEVVTNFGTTNMSPAPVINTNFNQSVSTSSTPSTAYIQLKFQDSTGVWQNGHTMTLPVH